MSQEGPQDRFSIGDSTNQRCPGVLFCSLVVDMPWQVFQIQAGFQSGLLVLWKVLSGKISFNQFHQLYLISRGWPRWAIALMTTTFAALLTEICSITASAALLLPLLSELATQLCIHPLYILLPATLACSLSFMLPAATPANAVAYGTGKLTVFDMVKSGAMANIIGILLVNIMLNTWGVYYWDLNSQDFRNWTDTQYCPEL